MAEPFIPPLRVAVIGSGPSAFYTAETLQKHLGRNVQIDMFERLPTPFGLVRGGVAPDHQKIKSVAKVYDRIAQQPGFRFFGNVAFGKHITHDDLVKRYHTIVYAVGAQTDRRMDIPGEDLPGSHAATEFVGWYNAHPDYRDLEFDLSQERVAVIGNGNVAIDVVRMLARSPRELQETDIADYALEALMNSKVKEIFLLGRRGPVQAKFTNPEIKELEEMDDANIRIYPSEIELDPMSQAYLLSGQDRNAERNYQELKHIALNPTTDKPKTITLRFLVAPVEIVGADRVEAIKLVQTEICDEGDGYMSPCTTDEHEILTVGLVFRSIGYHGIPLPDVPFDHARGIIPNDRGRVVDNAGTPLAGEYVVGWIKRGPTGIIGTNKPDAQETVARILEDIEQGNLLQPDDPDQESIKDLLTSRQIPFVTYADWLILDQIEQERGALVGRPRLKFSRVEDMLEALAEFKGERVQPGSRSNGKARPKERSPQIAEQPDSQGGPRRNIDHAFWHNKQSVRQNH